VKERAVELSEAMKSEDGINGAVRAFLKHLPPALPSQPTLPNPSVMDRFLDSLKRFVACS
jgi:sterol 3beta-glucosyltransferase